MGWKDALKSPEERLRDEAIARQRRLMQEAEASSFGNSAVTPTFPPRGPGASTHLLSSAARRESDRSMLSNKQTPSLSRLGEGGGGNPFGNPAAAIDAKYGKKGSDYRAGQSFEVPAIEESIIPDEELG
jgi:hypothetical protein